MLIHIVCWKYKPEVDDAAREEHRQSLRNLADVIPEIRRMSVGADILQLERSFDTGLVAEFDDEAALDTFTNHPDHLAVATIGRQIAARVISVDFVH
jgi:ribosomal protein L22